MRLSPKDLLALRNILLRAVREAHEVLADATRREHLKPQPQPQPQRPPTAAPRPIAVPPPASEPRRTYRIAEAAVLLGLSRSTIYKLIQTGDLKTLKIGGRRLIEEQAIEALIARHVIEASEAGI